METAAPGAFKGLKLQFLRDARTASIEVRRISAAMTFATKYWRHAERYNKRYRAYIGRIYLANEAQTPTEEPQGVSSGNDGSPIILAFDELKRQRDEGDRMLNTFNTKGSSGVKPTSSQVDAYIKQIEASVRQTPLGVTLKELAIFEQQWPKKDLYDITRKLAVAGCFSGNEPTVFERLWDRVERLKQLIYTLENR